MEIELLQRRAANPSAAPDGKRAPHACRAVSLKGVRRQIKGREMGSKRLVKPAAVFILLGSLFLVVSYLIGKDETSFSQKSFLSSALSNIAFVLLTVVIIDYLWGILGGEPVSNMISSLRESVEIVKDANETGARRILSASGTGPYGDHGIWMSRLERTEERLDLMGYTLHVWSRGAGFENTIVKLVKRGVRCRVLIMAPNNPSFQAVVNESIPGVTQNSTQGEADGARHLFEQIATLINQVPEGQRRGSFEFKRVARGTVLCQICRTDNEITVIPYLYSAVAARTPLLLVKGADGGLFKVYSEEFETLWNLN